MKRGALDAFLDLFSDAEDADEPLYDPVHLGGTLVASLVGIGALYWMLWTLLVFEGGLLVKISAALQVALSAKTLADFGYQGTPYAMGVFEGWVGNLCALALCVACLAALHRLHADALRKSKKR